MARRMKIARGRCLTIGQKGDVQLWDLEAACDRTGAVTGPPKPAMTIRHDGPVIDVAWSTSGTKFASVTETHLFIFDDTGTELRCQALAPKRPKCLCWYVAGPVARPDRHPALTPLQVSRRREARVRVRRAHVHPHARRSGRWGGCP